jgi:hypothetical protein
MPESGQDPFNPCGGGGGGFGGGGRGGGGGATAGPLVYPGTYTVQMLVAGKVVDSKPMRVSADPAVQMTDAQAKRYYDVAMDLHDMHRRAMEMANALNQVYPQMTDIGGKIGGMANVPAAVKPQFDAANKEFDAIRVKFGVPPPQGGGGGGRGGGGGGFGGGAAPSPADLAARVAAVKGLVLAFQDTPSDSAMRQYTDVKAALPKAILDGNAFLVKAMTLSQALKKHDLALTVPSPVK